MNLPYELPAGQYVVYALIDPTDQLVYYVGQTRHPAKRLAEHVRTRIGQDARAAWLRSLHDRKQQPIMRILEMVTGLETALQQEQQWIRTFLEKGMPLVNGETQREILQRRRSEQAATPLYEETILLCSYPLTRVWLPGGQTAIILSHLTDHLQLDRSGQLGRIQRDPLLRKNLVYVLIQTKGGPQIVLALVEEAVFSWIAGIQSGKLSPEKRPLLLAFQREVAKLTKPASQTASRLPRQKRRKAVAASKHEWCAMKAEIISLKTKRAGLEARIEKNPPAADAAQQVDTLLSFEHIRHLYVLACLLQSWTGESLSVLMRELVATLQVRDVGELPDSAWDSILAWFWQRSQR